MTPLSVRDGAQLSKRKGGGGRIKINLKDWGAQGDSENMKRRDKERGNATLQGSTGGGNVTEREERTERRELSGMDVNWKRQSKKPKVGERAELK